MRCYVPEDSYVRVPAGRNAYTATSTTLYTDYKELPSDLST